jgi:hypothetical protein
VGEDLEVFSEDEAAETLAVDAEQEPVFSLEDLCRICALQKPTPIKVCKKKKRRKKCSI